ncbi:hypothetical protein HAX54_015551 [Datura stramonium]|uniref:Uncharacterized protein n=1 Tax=Datura stramonium TaxID=4076 RepID=A0ABS8TT67_DATST|nr:hypothetical protein [Datura stramonium]
MHPVGNEWVPWVTLKMYEDIEESSSTFNKGAEQSGGQSIGVGKGIDEETLNDQVDGEEPFPTTPATTYIATKASSTTTPVTTSGTTTASIAVDPTIVNGDGPNLGPVRADFIDEEGFDYSINDSVG